MNTLLDLLQLLSMAGLGLAVGLACVGVWNVYVERLVVDARRTQDKETSLQSLRRVLLSRLNGFNTARFSEAYRAKITRTLVIAGDPHDLTATEIIGLSELSSVLFALFGVLLALSVDLRWWLVPAFALLGWYYPHIWLNDKVKKRQHAIMRALPYNLDLLTLSVEAGLDFAQALGKVVEKGRPGPLLEEFRLVIRNIKLGKTREEALRSMAERVGMAQVSSFCSALIQADRMGTSLGKILRIQSTQMRIERTNRAEKLANEAPVKMLFPLIGCIFPTVFMVLFGPIIFQALFGD